MSLMKWFRKNNKKIMAVVVIVIMIGFVGGSALQSFFQKRRAGLNKAVAFYGENSKITLNDMSLANRELEILKAVGANALLRSQDLQGVLMSEVLFADRNFSPTMNERIKRSIRTGGLRITNKQVNDIYTETVPKHILWLLLKKEAQQAGLKIPEENAGGILGRIIPQIAQGTTYQQLISQMMQRWGVSEKEVLSAFANLLAVMEYSRAMCSSEDITASQIRHCASMEQEKLDIEVVKFDSAIFSKNQPEPNEPQIKEQFEKYKKFPAGKVTEENPYGFGYKLPDRVMLEYIAVKLDDTSKIVTKPTQEDAEEFYQRHREQFVVQIPSDPNDPNSPLIDKTKSYAEMSNIILSRLLQNKIDSMAEKILQQAKEITEDSLQDSDITELTCEQFIQKAGDYQKTAEQLSQEYKIKVYTGKTGLLDATDIQRDKTAGMLYMKNYPTRLSQVVFAVDELGTSTLGPFDVPKPRMYGNIGPLKDISGHAMVLLRIIDAQKACEPESIDQTFSKSTFKLDQTDEQSAEDIYSVKEKVIDDLKKQSAMELTKSKAGEFIKQVVIDGWDGAIDKFNELYGQANEQEPNAFELRTLTNLQRIGSATIQSLEAQGDGAAFASSLIDDAKKERKLLNKFYSLIPEDSNSVETVPLIMEFKPHAAYYIIKNISVKRLEENQFHKIKASLAMRENNAQLQNLSAVYFDPENILKRTNFRYVEPDKIKPEPNSPEQKERKS